MSEGARPENREAAAIFEPDVIALMRKALDASWSALAFARLEDENDIRMTREALARRILERAAGGERRVPVLSGAALGSLEPRRAGRTPAETAGETKWRVSRSAS
jgi:hypothetical protein